MFPLFFFHFYFILRFVCRYCKNGLSPISMCCMNEKLQSENFSICSSDEEPRRDTSSDTFTHWENEKVLNRCRPVDNRKMRQQQTNNRRSDDTITWLQKEEKSRKIGGLFLSHSALNIWCQLMPNTQIQCEFRRMRRTYSGLARIIIICILFE